MTTSGTAKVTLPTDEQILITREFDAPRHLVYEAFTNPALVKRWWSGRRGRVTSAEIDLRVGGMWRYVMIATGGFEVAFHGEYREIVPDERLVMTEVYEMPGADPLPADGRAGQHDHLHRGGRPHDARDAHPDDEQGAARHDHRLRDGRRDAGGDGPAGAGRGLAALRPRGGVKVGRRGDLPRAGPAPGRQRRLRHEERGAVQAAGLRAARGRRGRDRLRLRAERPVLSACGQERCRRRAG